MSNARDDKSMDEYLRGDSDLSKRYRAIDADDVPPELDSLIIAQATKSAQANATKRPPSRWLRFAAPLAMAATVVLTVSILMQSGSQLSPSPTPSSLQKEVMEDAATTKEVAPSPILEQRVAPASSPPMAQQSNEQSQAKGQEKKKAAPTVALKRDEAFADKFAARTTTLITEQQYVAKRSSRANNNAQQVEQRERDETSTAGAPVRLLQPRSENTPAEQEAVATPALALNSAADSQVSNPPAPVAQSVQPAAKRQSVSLSSIRKNPSEWLDYIRQLRADGKSNEADEEWQRFRKAFPSQHVDDNDSARPR